MRKLIKFIPVFLILFAVVSFFGSASDGAASGNQSSKTPSFEDTADSASCDHKDTFHYKEYSRSTQDNHTVSEYCYECKELLGQTQEQHTWINNICPDCLEGFKEQN